jgi:hypothetical protein
VGLANHQNACGAKKAHDRERLGRARRLAENRETELQDVKDRLQRALLVLRSMKEELGAVRASEQEARASELEAWKRPQTIINNTMVINTGGLATAWADASDAGNPDTPQHFVRSFLEICGPEERQYLMDKRQDPGENEKMYSALIDRYPGHARALTWHCESGTPAVDLCGTEFSQQIEHTGAVEDASAIEEIE